ncbi:Oidioi.mRNA.OKI2018_I69.XSR.g17028.t2.cds [Oikopleura dioica]|uniref:peptide-O-fucosyltransferase n=1 Tax=Oikopleura dioica TaxID=34765 RepID=A0ABN7SN43_OIKDI|nr:Oidioi.mRNA.OKI2018_I69.XSR.g17028.t2.cds [Oikopleura dioica]
MAKPKKGSKKLKKSSSFSDARQLNVFIFLAGLSYAVFLVFSKLNRLQDELSYQRALNEQLGDDVPMEIFTTQSPSRIIQDSPPKFKLHSNTSPILQQQVLSKEEASQKHCFPKKNIDTLRNVQPEYNLDRSRFLVPILIWGPNNQIRGFIETIFLAIKLNRTLLVPPFFRHSSESDADQIEHAALLPPEMVIDIESVARLVPVASYAEANRLCGGRIDAVLLSRDCNTGPQYDRLKEFENYSELKFLKTYESTDFIKRNVVSNDLHVSDFFTAQVHPHDVSNLQQLTALHVPHDPKKLDALYGTDASCAAWVFPYRSFDFRAVGLSPHPERQTIAFSNKRFNDGIAVPLADADAMRRIYKIVQRPKSIRAGAEKFVNEVIGTRNYLAVHWRFDDSSFGSKVQSICGSESKDDHDRCQQIKDIQDDPSLIVNIIVNILLEWKINVFYIASPPTEGTFISRLIGLIEKKGSFRGYSGVSLVENLDPCLSGDPQVFSSVEQELCAGSKGFIMSPGSSWSLNTVIERTCRGNKLSGNFQKLFANEEPVKRA